MAGISTRTTRLFRAVLAGALITLVAPAAASADLDFKRCLGSRSECATLKVPLDRSGALPGQIPLKVERLQSAIDLPTMVYLSGGPGGAGIEEMRSVLPLVPQIAMRFRVVGFDQRGTGGSGLLRCPALERDARLRSPSAAEDCAQRLGAARTHYSTPDSVEDLEAIRQGMGVDRISLFGISYGTELALAYARAHPDHVDRLILDSVVDPDDRDPFGLAGFRAMGPTLAALCPGGCRGVSSNPVGDLAALVARLRTKALHGVAYDKRGRAHTYAIGATAISDLLYDADYNPPLRAGLPTAVKAAAAGDAAPLARLVAEGDGLADLPAPRSFSSARYATVCEETPLPWDATTPVGDRMAEARRRADALGPGAFAPFDFDTAAADEIELCSRWPGVPSGAVPAPGGAYPAVPTLILQGGEDLRTPPEGSARVAAAIPGAERVVVPGVGHAVVGGDPSGCGVDALRRFLEGKPVGGDCKRVATGVPAAAIPPRRLGAVHPAPGMHGRRGRTAAAIGLTVDDIAFAVSPAFLAYSGGGLRGGHFAVTKGRITITRYAAIRGVRISGRARKGRLRLRVGGSAAAHGRVTFTAGGRLRGRLGGREVSVRLPAIAARAAGAAHGSSGPSGLAGGSSASAAPNPVAALFRAPFVTKSSRSRLDPSPVR
jgi:pimeloyl-ACP methyl ester carboxylesterase